MKSDTLTKHTLNLYNGDYAQLQDLYPDIGAGPIIRRLIRKHLEAMEIKSEPVSAKIEL